MNKLKPLVVTFAFLALFGLTSSANASWSLAKGVDAEAAFTADFLWNLSGGLSESDVQLGNLDLIVTITTEEAGWWDNGTFFFYVLGNTDGNRSATDVIGDIQATSNIDAYETLKLYEAWYEHQFLEGRVGLLLGLHDYNSEFDVLEYAGLFLNSSFGISPDISQVGPSIFPVTAPAIRARISIGERAYFLAAAYDGIPGDPNDSRGTQIRFDSGDGIFAALEWGCASSDPGVAGYRRLAIGGWLHTAEVENQKGEPEDENGGVYLIAERSLGERTGIFFQSGIAKDSINRIDGYLGAGVVGSGIVPGREEDELGLAIAAAFNSDDFRNANPGHDHSETAIELTWHMTINENFSIQPDLQYILNPGGTAGTDDALQLGFRAMLSF